MLADDEARRAIIDLRVQVENLESKLVNLEKRLQSAAQGQLKMLNENERLQSEIARLRGQIEEASQVVTTSRSQQRDLYLDLDRRLNQQRDLQANLDRRIKQFEPLDFNVDGEIFRVTPEEKTKFEDLRESLRGGEFKKAAAAADLFLQAHPGSQLLPNVLLIRGSALYADKNYKAAIAARQDFIDRYPNHPARPQAMLNLAASHAESGNQNTARGILDGLIKSYPNSPVTNEARERLKGLRAATPTKTAPNKAGPSK